MGKIIDLTHVTLMRTYADLECLYVARVSAELLRHVSSRNYGGGATITDPATIEKAQRPCPHRSIKDGLDGHFFLEVCLGVHGAVVMIFHGYACQRFFALAGVIPYLAK